MFFSFLRSYVFALALCSALPSAVFAQVVPLSNFSGIGRSVQRSTIAEFNGSIYFGVGIDDSPQRELWRFNGFHTELVANGFFGETDLAVNDFVEFQGDLYFSASQGNHGHELYRFDGHTVSLAADLEPGADSSFPVGLMVHNDELYFSAKQGSSYNNLWKFDGTSATMVAPFSDDRASVVTGATYRGELYFGADHNDMGMELWKYDGNSVSPVAEINPGPADGYPRDFTVVGDTLYFKATTAAEGQEIWQYDGESISIVQDVNPGSKSSDPRFLTDVDGELMFSAVAYGNRSVYRFDGNSSQQIVDGGGPIQIDDDLFTIRGRHENGIEINDLHDLDGNFVRSTVPSAGPFETMDGNLFFSCFCSARELFMLAPAGDANSDGDVEFGDFLTLSKNFGAQGGGWESGDFDGSGMVGFPDFLLQSSNFGEKTGASVGRSLITPEPVSHYMALISASILFGFRRRRR